MFRECITHKLHDRETLLFPTLLHPQRLKQCLLRDRHSKNIGWICEWIQIKIYTPNVFLIHVFYRWTFQGSSKQAQEDITTPPSPQQPDASWAVVSFLPGLPMTQEHFLRDAWEWWLTKITPDAWSIIKSLSVDEYQGWIQGFLLGRTEQVSIPPATVVIKQSQTEGQTSLV